MRELTAEAMSGLADLQYALIAATEGKALQTVARVFAEARPEPGISVWGVPGQRGVRRLGHLAWINDRMPADLV